MDKVDEYKTASGINEMDLDKEVKKLIDQGFQPFGNPYVVTARRPEETMTSTTFCQAMVK